MKTLLKNITFEKYNIINSNINFEFNCIKEEQFLKYIESSKLFILLQTFSDINDIKNYNERDKLILTLFINQYINLNPTISSHNKYNEFLKPQIQMLNKKNISRGYFVTNDVLNKCNISLDKNKILNVSTIPTFAESYITLGKNNSLNIDYINVSSLKHDSTNPINNIYNELNNKFKSTYSQINFIDNFNFYKRHIQDIIKDEGLKPKYDLILFDTYKNIFEFNESLNIIDEYPKLNTNNINRFVSAIIHNKSLIQQIIFAINKLEVDGDLILLFSGFDNIFNNQLLILLGRIFNEILLFHSDKDYSFRYYVVCKKFNNDTDMIAKLNVQYEKFLLTNSSNILISIFDSSTVEYLNEIPQLSISNHLINKFNLVSNKITELTKFIDQKDLIIKLYNQIYYIQLLNSYFYLIGLFNINQINEIILNKLNEHKIKLFDKMLIPYKYSFNIESSNVVKFKFIFEYLNDNQIVEMFNFMKYNKLFDLVVFNDSYSNNDFIGIESKTTFFSKEIVNNPFLYELNNYLSKFDVNTNINIDTNKINIFDANNILENKLNLLEKCFNENYKYMVIKFKLNDLCPLLISIIYILSNIYGKTEIIKLESLASNFFIIFASLNENIQVNTNIGKIIETYNKTISLNKANTNSNNKNLYLVQIDDNFITTFNEIILKFTLKNLMQSLRYKFIYIGKSYTESYYSLVKQSSIVKNKIKEWTSKYLK